LKKKSRTSDCKAEFSAVITQFHMILHSNMLICCSRAATLMYRKHLCEIYFVSLHKSHYSHFWSKKCILADFLV